MQRDCIPICLPVSIYFCIIVSQKLKSALFFPLQNYVFCEQAEDTIYTQMDKTTWRSHIVLVMWMIM